jgi:hypothetical protein
MQLRPLKAAETIARPEGIEGIEGLFILTREQKKDRKTHI